MAFKFKHFLAGAAKEATNINEERRKRAMEMVQASMEMQGKSLLNDNKAHKEQGKELEVAAAGLRRLNLNDAQIIRVLNEGVDFANDFVEKAPIAAKARGVTPDTFVTIADPDAPLIPVSEYINRGDIAGRVEVGSFKRVEGLPKSIFGGTFDVEQDQTIKQYSSTTGLPIDEAQQERVSAPKGTIDIMGMIQGEKPDPFGATANKVFAVASDKIGSVMGLKPGDVLADGTRTWTSDVPANNIKYQNARLDLLRRANDIKLADPNTSDIAAMLQAVQEFEVDNPELFEVPDPEIDPPGGAVTGGDDLQKALDKGSPAAVAAVLSRDPNNAGKDVQAMAKELLDKHKGSAAAGAK
jgi:hypothetical protein